MRQFLNAFPLREGGGQRPGWMCLTEAQICAADSSFSFLWPSHKSPYRFENPSCAFGAALLQGPTQLARWTFSCHMRQFLNAFPLREGGGQRPGWMCLIEAQICTADSSFAFYDLLISRPTASRIHPAPLARPFSKGLLAWHCPTLTFTPLRGSILRLRRAPSLRGYSLGTIQHWLLHRCRESILRLWRGPSPRAYTPGIISHGLSYRRRLTICLLSSQSLRRCAGGLLRGRS